MPTPTAPRPQPTLRTITPELIRDALACIPPDVDRDTWARVGMAIKSELSGEPGFALWDEWSGRGETYDAKNARDTWRSIKAGGRTTVGTLFGIAKDHGFKFPDAAEAQTPEQVAAAGAAAERLANAKRRQREAEAADYRRRADLAARDAVALWASGSDAGQSPYLVRKGVQGHGVRYLPDGTLLVPMIDAAGELQNLQRIAPAPPAGGGPEKRFLPGGRKSGLWHVIGQVEGSAVLLLAEGLATAASVHEATRRPVVVCFDAGNLVHVTKAMRERWPALPLLVCADDDADTEARTGKNPGRDKAMQAARAAGLADGLAAVVLPVGLPAGGSDFNDLGQHAGPGAVAALVDVAAASLLHGPAHQAGETGAGAATTGPDDAQVYPAPAAAPGGPALRLVPGGKGKPAKAAKGEAAGGAGGGGRSGGGDDAPAGGGDDGDGDGGAPALPDPFMVNQHGVWHIARDAEGNDKRPVWMCARLVVTARTRSDDLNGWGFLLEFNDPDGNAKSWAMPSAMLSGEGAEWAGRLRDMGLQMAPGTRARNLLAQYIDTRCVFQRSWTPVSV